MKLHIDDRAEIAALATGIGAKASRRISVYTIVPPLTEPSVSQDLRQIVDTIASMTDLKPLGALWLEVSEANMPWQAESMSARPPGCL